MKFPCNIPVVFFCYHKIKLNLHKLHALYCEAPKCIIFYVVFNCCKTDLVNKVTVLQ